MDTSGLTNPYQHHRFPAEIISHGVWLYYRFCLSYRDVERIFPPPFSRIRLEHAGIRLLIV
jgi:putative transposase